MQREVADRLSEAESRLKDAEMIHDNFFIETIHEMRTPLSLVLGSLALVVQNKDEEKDMSTQLLSAYRNTLALQDLADQLIGTRRANDVANYLRIARYDLVEISRQICDLFVDWVAMNNVDFRSIPRRLSYGSGSTAVKWNMLYVHYYLMHLRIHLFMAKSRWIFQSSGKTGKHIALCPCRMKDWMRMKVLAAV